jgi:hypothetical protein
VWSDPVESIDCLLKWRVWMVCASKENGWSATVEVDLLQWKLWMSALVEFIDGCFWQTYRSVSRSPDSSSS